LLAFAALACAAQGRAALARPSGAGERAVTDRVKSGTGFFVSRDGFLLTSAHVVAGCQHVSVWDSAGTSYRSYTIGLDRRLDVALLWAEGISPSRLASVTRMSVQRGEPVVTLGYGVIPTEPLKPVLVEGLLIGDRTARAEATESTVGGGSLPGQTLPSWGVAVAGSSPDGVLRRLRSGKPAVVARIVDGAVVLDLRTVEPRHDGALADAIRAALPR